MFRNLLSKSPIDTLTTSIYNVSINPVCVQSVRWRRKPRWLPPAKTKMFRVPVRPVLPEEEKHEWLRLNNNYRTQMRSVRLFFREEVARKKQKFAQEMTPEDEETEFQRCITINDEWNFEISKIRDARLAKENAERRVIIQSGIAARKIKQREELKLIEERVRKQKEASVSFITSENIDQAIEQALANPTDYNFSIDLQGNIYKGDQVPENVADKNVKS